MNIHVVQPGDTIYSIADSYRIPVERLIQDNGINSSEKLVIGQTIVIVYPEKTYIIQDGDTLVGIANAYGVSLRQLLRNNPHLSDRNYIYPGETIVISYNNNLGKVQTVGYTNTFISREVLKKTLPFLTYLSIFGYRTIEKAEIIGIDDDEIIQLAKDYGVAPIMLLSTLTEHGEGNIEIMYNLYNQELVERHINNMLIILKRKGYYGINITFQFITEDNRQAYENYITKVTKRLNSEGFLVFITLSPNIVYRDNSVTFEQINYSVVGQEANGIMLMTYNWGYSYGPPAPVSSLYSMKQFLEYVLTLIPAEKVNITLSVLGYNWQLPYQLGLSKANALTYDSALTLAREMDAIIQYDEVSQNPYFKYVDLSTGIPKNHIVWFIDARTVDATVKLLPEYGLSAAGVWNIMSYFTQLWLVINSQYEIETVLN